MKVYKHLPLASERMGILWAIGSIKDACLIEFGPEGTMHYAISEFGLLNAELSADFYTTGMEENNIIMGDTDVLANAIIEIDRQKKPEIIFVIASTVSSVIGTDISAICKECEQQINAKIICFDNISLNTDYAKGIEKVLSTLAKEVVEDSNQRIPTTYNIIGCNIDSYNFSADLNELKRIMKDIFGYKLHTVMTAKSSIGRKKQACQADFNIVLRQEGFECANILKKKYNMDYIYGVPYGKKGTLKWIESICNKFKLKKYNAAIEKECIMLNKEFEFYKMHIRMKRGLNAVVTGNYDFVVNSHQFFSNELGLDIKKLIVNHSDNVIDKVQIANEIKGLLYFDNDERLKYEYLEKINPSFILGDGMLLSQLPEHIRGYQVSNPNAGNIKRYTYTPFVGFRGAMYLIQEISNLLE